MKIKRITLIIKIDDVSTINPNKIRGFFATKFTEHFLLHHHIDVDRYLYKYPLIQYKVLNHTPTIIGINEGVRVIKNIFSKFDFLSVNGEKIPIIEKEIRFEECEFGISDKSHTYHFLTSWLALNKKNLETYNHIKGEQKVQFLDRILIGNLISISKSLNYTVSHKIEVYHNLRQLKKLIRYKNSYLLGFKGIFHVNFNIPNFLGIGKGVSKGYGTIYKFHELKRKRMSDLWK